MGRKKLFVVPFLFLGTALLVGSIWSVFSLKSMLDQGTLTAKALDYVFGTGGSLSPDPCRTFQNNTPALSAEVIPTQRVMSESDTQVLTVSLTNHNKTLTCDEDVGLDAPEFDVSPAITSDRHMTIPPGQKRSLIWILAPRKLGTFMIGAGFSPLGIEPVVGITVTNVFGLTIWQAQLLSSIGTFLGTFFGPVLSFTWWYTLWKKRRKKKHSRTSSTNAPPALQAPQGPLGKLLVDKEQSNKSSAPGH